MKSPQWFTTIMQIKATGRYRRFDWLRRACVESGTIRVGNPTFSSGRSRAAASRSFGHVLDAARSTDLFQSAQPGSPDTRRQGGESGCNTVPRGVDCARGVDRIEFAIFARRGIAGGDRDVPTVYGRGRQFRAG